MGGGGGFVGASTTRRSESVNAGYATVGTDTGHQGAVAPTRAGRSNNLERQLNFGHVAVHRAAEVAKAIVRQHYGIDETR